ncbi:MAG: Hsp20/alpha crystallin family protein [Candidatus Gribaldobacteria bacterium]|nr:Hsp20/alpha crystallin family protein [Candidatus Gribaldobacteria bacterium]
MFFKKPKKDIGFEESLEHKPAILDQKKSQPELTKKEKCQPAVSSELSISNLGQDSGDWLKAKGQLTVDVYQINNEFCIVAPIAGVDPADISLGLEKAMLIIKGERKDPDQSKEKRFFYQECYFGQFARQIILPEDADTSNIKASFKKGMLTIRIPKINKQPQKIRISVEE